MSKTHKLSSLENQVLFQMITTPEISDNFSPGLTKSILKVGVGVILSVLALSSQMAHADSTLRTMLGVSAVSGLMTHKSKAPNTPDECNIQGISGWKVGGATAAGSLLGNQFGKGKGKKLLTAGLGGAAGTSMYLSESDRIEKEKQACYQRIAERNARNSMQHPQYAPHNAMTNPENNVLYTFTNQNFRGTQVVTMANSPGINALNGAKSNFALREITPNSQAEYELKKATDGFFVVHNNLENNSKRYLKLQQQFESQKSPQADFSPSNKAELEKIARDVDKSFTAYSQERAYLVATLDKLTTEGYDITPNKYLLSFMNVPEVLQVSCNCIVPNRYSTVPQKLTQNFR